MKDSQRTVIRLVGAGVLVSWFVFLGYVIWTIRDTVAQVQTGDWASFVLISFVFGALGGLIQATMEYSDYTTRVDYGGLYPANVAYDTFGKPTQTAAVREARHFTFCIALPLLRPLLGSGTGFALAAVIQDVGVHPGRVALVSLVGGYFANSLMKSLGKTFGVGGP